jgi:thiol:disulfide interchange protein DsbC
MFRKTLFVALALASTATFAAPDQAAIEKRIKEINPKAVITSIQPTPIAGLNEVMADGQPVYLSDDGRYLFHGSVLDMEERVNLTDLAGASIRKDLLDKVPDSEKIVFAPAGETKHTVRIFTDISCGYCKKLHQEIQSYLDHGIRVEYLAFPRGGEQSPAFADMEAIWCAKNTKIAYESAVAGDVPSLIPCSNPVRNHYELGDRLGVQGTPAIYTTDGVQVGGYVPAAELLAQLNAKAKAKTARASGESAAAAGAP